MNDELIQVVKNAMWREREKILTAKAEISHLIEELDDLGVELSPAEEATLAGIAT